MSASSTTHTNSNSSSHYSYYESLLDCLKWASKRIPNAQEVLAASLPTSLFGTVFEDFVNSLGNNPSAKSFIRDIQKASGTIYATYVGAEHGGTGVKYDAGHAYSAVLKPSFKTGFIVSAYFVGIKDIPSISRMANLGGECIARLLANVSIKKQELNDTQTEYFQFASENTDSKLLFQAGTEALTKTATSDFVGTMIGYLGISKLMHTASLHIETKFINSVLGSAIRFTHKDTLLNGKYTKIMSHDGTSTLNKVASFAMLSALDIALKTVSEVTVTYMLAPGVRIVQDGTWPAYQYIKDIVYMDANKNQASEHKDIEGEILITPKTSEPFIDQPIEYSHNAFKLYDSAYLYSKTQGVEIPICTPSIDGSECDVAE